MKQCPNCNAEYFEGNYCWLCGMVLVPLLEEKCDFCGKEIYRYHNYCRWCGNKLGNEPVEMDASG